MAGIIVLGTASTDPDLDRQCVAEDLDDLDQAARERLFLQFAAGSPDAETQALLTSILDDCA